MDNQQEHLENFLRNKLNEFDEANDGWDRPDPEVWEQVQHHLPNNSTPPLTKGKTWGIIGLAAAVIIIAGYIASLQLKINDLEKTLAKKESFIPQEETSIPPQESLEEMPDSNLPETLQKLQTELSESKQAQQLLKQENQALAQENQAVKQHKISLQNHQEELEEKMQHILEERTETEPLIAQAEKPTQLELANIPSIIQAQSNFKFHQSNSRQLTEYQANTPNKWQINLPKNKLPKWLRNPKYKFEVGYEYALSVRASFSEGDFEDWDEEEWDNKYFNWSYGHLQGVRMGFSPAKNFFIRTGLQAGVLRNQKEWEAGAFYDKEGEYAKPNGELVNEVTLLTRGLYGQGKSDIVIGIPSNINIEDRDSLKAEITEKEVFNHIQIPIGLEYFVGERRLQLQLMTGMQWNYLKWTEYELSAEIEVENKELEIEQLDTKKRSEENIHFVGVYAGLGLSYRIKDHWFMRAAWTLNYDNLEVEEKRERSENILIGNNVNIGFHYRF